MWWNNQWGLMVSFYLFSTVFGNRFRAQANNCEIGKERVEEAKGIRKWSLSNNPPCGCSSTTLGGVNTQTPIRSFKPSYVDQPVLSGKLEENPGQNKLPCNVFLRCPGNQSHTTPPGNATVVVMWGEPNVIGNSIDDVILTCHPPSGSYFHIGKTVVTCQAVDNAGNSDTCHFAINVLDQEPPIFQRCPVNQSHTTSPGNATVVVTWGEPVAIDNSIDDVNVTCHPPAGSYFHIGTTVVTCQAVDNAGNSYTCNFTINVLGQEFQIFHSCPGNQSHTTPPGYSTVVVTWGEAVAIDNPIDDVNVTCHPPAGSYFHIGKTVVTCQAVDNAGNSETCNFTIGVLDQDPPVFHSCPGNRSHTTPPGNATVVVTWGEPVAIDNSIGGVNVTCHPPTGSHFHIGKTVVTCQAVDNAGNSDTCRFTIGVFDQESPVFHSCPGNQSHTTPPGNATVEVTWGEPVATDNSIGDVNVICYPPSGSHFHIGKTVVTCQAVDNAGNSDTCNFTIGVLDTDSPIMSCPKHTMINKWPIPVTADNSRDIPNIVCQEKWVGNHPPGVFNVLCIATDSSGNKAECSFLVEYKECFKHSATYHTPTVREYQWKSIRIPSHVKHVTFATKIEHTAYIALSAENRILPDCYEIVIGGWSTIRKASGEIFPDSPDGTAVINPSQFCEFTISWGGGRITVYKGNETVPFLNYTHSAAFPINYIGFSGYVGEQKGKFKFCEYDTCLRPLNVGNATQNDNSNRQEHGKNTHKYNHDNSSNWQEHEHNDSSRIDVWVAGSYGQEPFILIDFKRLVWMAGIEVHGKEDYNRWIDQYKVQHSVDGRNWMYVTNSDDSEAMVFEGNTDKNTSITTTFAARVLAKYTRIGPIQYNDYVSLKFSMLGCPGVCNLAVGWSIKQRLTLDGFNNLGFTMVAQRKQFPCDGFVTAWRYYAVRPGGFRALVFRSMDKEGNNFEVVGFNDIPSGDLHKPAEYMVPDEDHIKVRRGDHVGWSFKRDGVLTFDRIQDNLVGWTYGFQTSNSFMSGRKDYREYSIEAKFECEVCSAREFYQHQNTPSGK